MDINALLLKESKPQFPYVSKFLSDPKLIKIWIDRILMELKRHILNRISTIGIHEKTVLNAQQIQLRTTQAWAGPGFYTMKQVFSLLPIYEEHLNTQDSVDSLFLLIIHQMEQTIEKNGAEWIEAYMQEFEEMSDGEIPEEFNDIFRKIFQYTDEYVFEITESSIKTEVLFQYNNIIDEMLSESGEASYDAMLKTQYESLFLDWEDFCKEKNIPVNKKIDKRSKALILSVKAWLAEREPKEVIAFLEFHPQIHDSLKDGAMLVSEKVIHEMMQYQDDFFEDFIAKQRKMMPWIDKTQKILSDIIQHIPGQKTIIYGNYETGEDIYCDIDPYGRIGYTFEHMVETIVQLSKIMQHEYAVILVKEQTNEQILWWNKETQKPEPVQKQKVFAFQMTGAGGGFNYYSIKKNDLPRIFEIDGETGAPIEKEAGIEYASIETLEYK